MDTMQIGSFNVKDNAVNRNGGVMEDGRSSCTLLAREIQGQLDFLGTQEMTVHFTKAMQELLSGYQFYWDYRYGNGIFKSIPYNENNCILTNHDVYAYQTVHLPWIARNWKDLKESITSVSIMPRIATMVLAKDGSLETFCMINTHLNYQVKSVQIRQLQAIKYLLLQYSKYPIVLTGDFNMELTDSHFSNFVASLKHNHMTRVPIDDYTWYDGNGKGKTCDHIFISDCFEVIEASVSKKLSHVSDYRMVMATIRRK